MNVSLVKESMLMNKVELQKKNLFFLVRPETYRVMCHIHIHTTTQIRLQDA